jgi:hypothetical protein
MPRQLAGTSTPIKALVLFGNCQTSSRLSCSKILPAPVQPHMQRPHLSRCMLYGRELAHFRSGLTCASHMPCPPMGTSVQYPSSISISFLAIASLCTTRKTATQIPTQQLHVKLLLQHNYHVITFSHIQHSAKILFSPLRIPYIAVDIMIPSKIGPAAGLLHAALPMN